MSNKQAWFITFRIAILSLILAGVAWLYLEYKLNALERRFDRVKTIEVEKYIPTPKPTIIKP